MMIPESYILHKSIHPSSQPGHPSIHYHDKPYRKQSIPPPWGLGHPPTHATGKPPTHTDSDPLTSVPPSIHKHTDSVTAISPHNYVSSLESIPAWLTHLVRILSGAQLHTLARGRQEAQSSSLTATGVG
jgi:hypothetical protein